MSDIYTLVKTSVITFDLPFMINLPDGPYDVNIESLRATVFLIRTRSPSDMPGLPQGIKFPPDVYVKGDKLGRFNYTKIKIAFHHEIFIKPGIMFQDLLLLKSVDIINTIFDVCRDVKGDHYIRINNSDIFSHNLTYLNPHGQVIPGGAYAVGGQIEIGTGGAYQPIPQEVSKIKTILSTNAKLPLWQKLLFDAYDKHFYREYRSAVVEAGTAFEVFVYDFIRKGYVRLGKTEQEIDDIFKSGLKNLLLDHVRILTGKDFRNSNEYTLWESDLYKMRNQIVHSGAMATDVDSAKATNTVGDTIKFMLSLNNEDSILS